MKVIPAWLKKFECALSAAVIMGCMMTSCDNAIYDYEGDCSVTYRLAFCYDKNMAWADAFAREVKSVHLYAFDPDGILVWQNAESGEALAAEDYTMTLDLPAGSYRLLAWCGLENGGQREESFAVPAATVGKTRIEELECRLNRQHDAAGAAHSREKLYPLFHGMCDVNLPDDLDGADYLYTMPLTKDTNHVRIILQQLSGQPVDPGDFTFRIEAENGRMNYDNKLLSDELITYWAHDTKSGSASLGIDDYPELGGSKRQAASRAITTAVNVAIADLTIARMVPGRSYTLTVETQDGRESASIPLVDYALLLKDGYDEAMTDEEYLDRQDEYQLVFFLDEDRSWIKTSIIINSWKVVLNQIDF